jgi:S13-like protein
MGATMIATTSSARLEQRMEALERANEIRSLRAQLKRDLKGGRKAIEEVLSRPADYLATMTILDLLIWTPKRKRIRASQVLRRCQITPSRTIGALTERQRESIIAELRRPGS